MKIRVNRKRQRLGFGSTVKRQAGSKVRVSAEGIPRAVGVGEEEDGGALHAQAREHQPAAHQVHRLRPLAHALGHVRGVARLAW